MSVHGEVLSVEKVPQGIPSMVQATEIAARVPAPSLAIPSWRGTSTTRLSPTLPLPRKADELPSRNTRCRTARMGQSADLLCAFASRSNAL